MSRISKTTKSFKSKTRDRSKHSRKNYKHKARLGGGKAGLSRFLILCPCQLGKIFRITWSLLSQIWIVGVRWDDYGEYAIALDRGDPNYDSQEEEEDEVPKVMNFVPHLPRTSTLFIVLLTRAVYSESSIDSSGIQRGHQTNNQGIFH